MDRPPPSVGAIAVASAVIAGVTGYFLGQASAIGVFSQRKPTAIERSSKSKEDQETEDSDSDSDLSEIGELGSFVNSHEEFKLILVVRTDLGMTKGKIAAQCSHATLACYKSLASVTPKSPVLSRWESRGQAKVAVQVKSEDELLELQARAMSLGLCARVIHDAGRTQIAANSATVLGIGPGPKSVIDQVTGHLKLL
ncbi:putative mitochondrial peptidyl-tRNA hydrolase Pth2 [Eremomyces bilateralis CBS 781.70]|uniref:peptidyl-tRNA hydrolase n=1 Tax=Eremomyces bilateralis CBS 781.70 TaxID=1392243 RepID=A0A6G1FU04_9PEZI|nr:putative mitochondrial peptidyl-tRNA hydrolase Pth2 [Eremomyces bilateralis CBS 781.70]KAF1809172.1 putative mitochondrial peptidyl-tRNA hydrolase Pth2 [Eremomyces bilateralis CBS 781.70]